MSRVVTTVFSAQSEVFGWSDRRKLKGKGSEGAKIRTEGTEKNIHKRTQHKGSIYCSGEFFFSSISIGRAGSVRTLFLNLTLYSNPHFQWSLTQVFFGHLFYLPSFDSFPSSSSSHRRHRSPVSCAKFVLLFRSGRKEKKEQAGEKL